MVFLDDYFGEPAREGVPARPGVMGRLKNLEDMSRAIRSEVTMDSGQSMNDLVRRTAADVLLIKDDLGKVKSGQEGLRARVEQIERDRTAS
jgi:hypothetical protein